jgi:hypothetical protein
VLRAGVLWKFFREQDLAFWAMCFYLIVEYIRPQQLSSLVNGWPLGIIALGLAAVGYMLSGAPGFGMKGVGSWLLLLFTAILIASSITAYDPSVSFAGIRVWYSWVAIYFLIINVVNTRQRFAFFILLWLMCHYYMSQGGAKQFAGRGFSFAPWGIIGAPGWFANSGEFGIAMCMMVAVSWHYYAASAPYLTKMRKIFVLGMPVTAALGVIGSSSRGAVIGLGAIGALILLRSKIQPRSFIAVALIAMAASRTEGPFHVGWRRRDLRVAQGLLAQRARYRAHPSIARHRIRKLAQVLRCLLCRLGGFPALRGQHGSGSAQHLHPMHG